MHQSSRFVIAVLAASLLAGASSPSSAQSGPIRRSPVTLEMRALEALNDLRVLQDRAFTEERTDRETRTLDIGASGFLELGNITGDITVTAASGTAARVEIVRRSRGRSADDVERGLREVTVGIEESPGGARVRARYPDQEGRTPYSVSVAYVVSAPAGTRLTVNSVVGDVTIHGLQGDISVDVISGSIDLQGARGRLTAKAVSGDITIADVRTGEAMDVTSINGDITVRDARSSRIGVNTVSGDVRVLEAQAAGADLKSMAGDVIYQGTLAAGARYALQAHSGDVEVIVDAGAGFDLEASTFSGDIRPAPQLALTNVSTSRRTLRGRAGAGGATITATTFSGDVVIRRR